MRFFIAALISVAPLCAQVSDPPSKLEYIAVLSRHGVRSAIVSMDTLSQYSTSPWRPMDVPMGYLTARGRAEMQSIGVWDLHYLEQNGLIDAKNCDDAPRFYFRSDSIQRDVESARAIAWGMFPNCTVAINAPAFGVADPMFLGATSPGLLDRDLAAAALEGRTGGDPTRILKTREAEVEIIQKVLSGNGPAAKKTLTTPPPSEGDRYTRASGPVAAVSGITDALLLEYEEGFPANETAWGRLNESNLPALLSLHEALVDQTWDIPYVARARGSNLMAHILESLEQAAEGHPVLGALGKPGDKGVFVLGHDSDFGNFATMLNLSWILESLPLKATPPGAAMMFELWKDAAGKRSVRVSIMAQTVGQIHNGVAPTAQTPPLKIPIFIPGCSASPEGFACEWGAFRRVLESAIDFGQVRPEPVFTR